MDLQTTSVSPAPPSLFTEIEERLGVLPALYRRGSHVAGAAAFLWSVAQFSYLDNPLPPLFKERLVVQLSRFCESRYCIARHVGFLLGCGHPAGERAFPPEPADRVLRLVRQPMPLNAALEPHLVRLERGPSPRPEVPPPEAPDEQALLACAAHVFLRTSQADRCLEAIRRALGPRLSDQLALLLTYVRTVHDWTRIHPGIEVDEDVRELLERHADLAAHVLDDAGWPATGEDRPTTPPRSDGADVDPASLLEAIVDLVPISVFVKDAGDLTFVRVNRANEELLGIPRGAQLGRTDHDFFPVEEARFFREKDREALGTDAVVDIPEEPLHTAHGLRWLHTRKIRIRDAEGHPTHLLGISSDITEQKRARDELIQARELLESRVEERTIALRREIEDRKRIEEALRASEEMFRLAAEAFDGIIVDHDAATGRSTRSRGLRSVLGYDPDTVPATSGWWFDQVHPDERERVERAYTHLDEHPDGRIRIEYRIRHRDGRWRTIDERAVVRPNAEGRLTRVVGSIVDVTERVEALQALRESEAEARQRHEELKAVYDSTPVGLCLLDPQLRFVRLNERLAEINGLPVEDHIGRTLREVVPAVADQIEPVLQQVLRTGEPVTDFEVTCETNAQPRVQRTWLASWYPLRADGRFVGVNSVVQEITDRKRAERLLVEQKQVLELIASGCSLETSLDATCRALSRLTAGARACIQVADPRAPALVRTFAPDFCQSFAEDLSRAGLSGATRPAPCPEAWREVYRPYGPQACHCAPIPTLDDTSATVMLCFDEDRGPRDWELRLMEFGTHLASIALERDRATRAVRESESLFRTLGEAVEVLLWMTDAAGAPVYRNPAWFAYSGMTPAEAGTSDAWQKLLHPDDLPKLLEARADSLRSGCPYRVETRCRRYDGQYRWFLVRTVPVRDPQGQIVSWVGTATDVHNLNQAREALKEADKRKDEFLATLAHELRNPLAPIRNALRLIQRSGGAPDEIARARSIMERQVGHMVVLIDDLLDVSRISRGKMMLRREPLELSVAIAHGIEAARPLVKRFGHRLSVALPDEPIVVEGDLTRLAQVVGNLLTNSAKYTPPGGDIRVAAERQRDEVVLTVSDTGIGIAPSELDRVFELFSQVDRSLERTSGGLGIGLSLVRGLVEMHGGTVTASSGGEGRGSTFTMRLPIAQGPAPAPKDEATPAPSPARQRVLVVDDNVDGAQLLAELVRLSGNDVRTAYDGLEAVTAAAEFRPDLILMDVAMPKLNGLEATRRIRAQPWGRSIRIVALSGWGQDTDRVQSAAAGCDDHLVKPVDPRLIEDLLASVPPADR
jgi:PAS domain S-box-containing protein